MMKAKRKRNVCGEPCIARCRTSHWCYASLTSHTMPALRVRVMLFPWPQQCAILHTTTRNGKMSFGSQLSTEQSTCVRHLTPQRCSLGSRPSRFVLSLLCHECGLLTLSFWVFCLFFLFRKGQVESRKDAHGLCPGYCATT